MPIGMPIRSIHRNRRPMSRTRLLVPRTALASDARRKKPAHSPSRLDTTYQVGGSVRWVMAVSEPRWPLTAAIAVMNRAARTWPARKPRAAKSTHTHADPRVEGDPPGANLRVGDTPGRRGGGG